MTNKVQTLVGQVKPVDVFVLSCAHEDEELCDELAKHLALLESQGYISSCHDFKVTVGSKGKAKIDEHLKSAQIILLLVSPDFLASDYGLDGEMKRALERHRANEARVIPVILRHINWQETPFARLQALPVNGRPVTDFPDRDKAFAQVAEGIRRVAKELRGEGTMAIWSWLPLPGGSPAGTWLFAVLVIAAALLAGLLAGKYFW